MKRIFLACMALFAMFFVACDNKTSANNDVKKDDKKVIKVGTNASYPPFEYTIEGNTIVGFDIDLFKEIAQKIGIEYEIVNMDFDGLIPALKTGKIDLAISAMSATPDRKKYVSFSNVYYAGSTILFIKRSNDNKINSVSDLKGKKVGVFLGTVQDIYATDLASKDKSIKVVKSSDMFGSIMNLKNKKVDVVLSDGATGKEYIAKNKDIVSFLEQNDGSDGFSIAFDKDKNNDLRTKINKAIDEIKSSPAYDDLLKKYNLK